MSYTLWVLRDDLPALFAAVKIKSEIMMSLWTSAMHKVVSWRTLNISRRQIERCGKTVKEVALDERKRAELRLIAQLTVDATLPNGAKASWLRKAD